MQTNQIKCCTPVLVKFKMPCIVLNYTATKRGQEVIVSQKELAGNQLIEYICVCNSFGKQAHLSGHLGRWGGVYI